MSVWETVDDLKDFVYNSGHMEVFNKRAKWFERMKTPHMALWWVKEGDYPTAQDGKNKLFELEKYGETQSSFSFKELFEAPIPKSE
jgi:hypothetical protein